MHPRKERRSFVNGDSSKPPKHKPSKSTSKLPTYYNFLGNVHAANMDRATKRVDPYVMPGGYNGGSSVGLVPETYSQQFRCAPPGVYTDHHLGYEPSSLPVYPQQWTGRPRPMRVPWEAYSTSYFQPMLPPGHDYGRPTNINIGGWIHNEEDFSSLPPVFHELKPPPVPAPTKQPTSGRQQGRRFSDPGLGGPGADLQPQPGSSSASGGNSEESSGGSSSEREDPTSQDMGRGGLVQRLLLETSYLRDTNMRLLRDLEETRTQLEVLRSSTGWHRMGPEYRPGMLVDMVREMREASRIREEAMMSRLKLATGLADQEHPNEAPQAALPYLQLKRLSLGVVEEHARTPLSHAGSARSSLHQHSGRLQDIQGGPSGSRGGSGDELQGPQSRRRSKRHHRSTGGGGSSRSSLHGSIRGESSGLDEGEEDDEISSMSGGVVSPAAGALSGSVPPSNAASAGLSPGVLAYSAGALAEQVQQLRREKQQLSQQLRQVSESRNDTDAHVQKLERLVTILRKKIAAMNGLEQLQAERESVGSGPPSLSLQLHVPNPASESLTASTASSSAASSLQEPGIILAPPMTNGVTPSHQVTIHGPVTNL